MAKCLHKLLNFQFIDRNGQMQRDSSSSMEVEEVLQATVVRRCYDLSYI